MAGERGRLHTCVTVCGRCGCSGLAFTGAASGTRVCQPAQGSSEGWDFRGSYPHGKVGWLLSAWGSISLALQQLMTTV